ncbi:MAG TPA: hypothetical protein VGA16_01060 [Candidatus Limnocylindria bacterium]
MRLQLDRRWLAQWIGIPLLAGALLALIVPPPSAWSVERMSAVLLLDGQAYFGHVTEVPWSDTVQVNDVYYFQDARGSSMNLPLGLQRRGGELHQPTDGMSLRRDKILAIEPLSVSSAVRRAIAVERVLQGAR